MWRYNANRTAASPQELPAKLHLHWMRSYPPQKPAWPEQPLMPFDAGYEPVVMGQTLFLGSSRSDSLTAIDTRSGEERWRFFADGPIRFAPVAWEGKVYVVSDDGYLYCLDAAKGSLVWKFRGGPSDRKILGNERLISTWPARGAPVIADGTIYFAASIWPFMGIFIHALDAQTGKVIWTNDGDGSTYMKQPHNTDSFAGVAPQGPMAVLGDKLFIPGGRSVPACYDRKTGKLLYYLLAESSKKGGGSEVAALGPVFLNGGAAFETEKGKFLGAFASEPVLTPDVIYGFQKDACRSFDLKNAEITPPKWKIVDTGSFDIKEGTALIKAGNRLIVGAKNKLMSVQLPLPKTSWPDVTWEYSLQGTPATILTADDRLFVATLEGKLFCFGKEEAEAKLYPMEHLLPKNDEWTKKAIEILDTTNVREGYCVSWGVGSGRLITALARRSKLNIIAVEKDEKKVRELREMLTTAGFYGERISIIHGDPMKVELPPYLASLMVSEDPTGAGVPNMIVPTDLDERVRWNEKFYRKAFEILRPFGGVACIPISRFEQKAFSFQIVDGLKLRNGVQKTYSDGILLIREGPLPNTDNWTHEHADAQNTRVSTDAMVKAPLGLLWFGGPSHEGILPRHGHGPQPQVIDGRLIMEGVDLVRATDIYTGRLLWETKLPGVGAFYDNTAHQPGANAAGTNFISTSEAIYIAYRNGCVKLDPETGKKIGEFKMPDFGEKKISPRWGYINVIGDYLIGGGDPLYDPKMDIKKIKPANPLASDDDKPKTTTKTTTKTPSIKLSENDNYSGSKHLVVMNRHTGEVLWTADARYSFRHNGICAGGGRVYAIDRLSGTQIKKLTKDGDMPDIPARILAFDLKAGKQIWQSEDDVFGTWLSYSEKHDVLIEAGRVARDTLFDEPKGMRAFRAKTGVVMWRDKTFLGPAMIHGDTILKDRSACDLLTGEPKMRPDPLTGEPSEWTWVRNYGCNTPLASQNLMTFRSGAAGYLDLCNDGGTGNFGGFRSSCTNNLIVAGGVLCAPEYTRTCTCSYQNQSSVCLVNMPDNEMWTSFGKVGGKGPIKRVGVNFGAPGDRRADDGSLWLEYPSVGGLSPVISVHVAGKVDYFRKHQARVEGPMNWVTASGIRGIDAVALTLGSVKTGEKTYTVRLYFAEPDDLNPGERLFDISLQGKPVLENFDIVKEAGGANKSLIKEFKGVKITDELKVVFESRTKGKPPILCGLEVVAEGW